MHSKFKAVAWTTGGSTCLSMNISKQLVSVLGRNLILACSSSANQDEILYFLDHVKTNLSLKGCSMCSKVILKNMRMRHVYVLK